ncbi:MAG: DNA-3-methyladenine glycosylase [Pyrinomonadaceae bacterium]
MEISIPVPPDFSFKRTVLSHGWYQLLPLELDRERWQLTCVLSPSETQPPVTAIISGANDALTVNISRGNLSKSALARITRDVRHIFRLDDNLTQFYAAMKADADFAWIAGARAGRLLRSATVYEDLIKTICTTNCSWAMTEKMVTGLVINLGREAKDKRRAFPKPEAMAAAPLEFYTNEVRAGYRASYLKELAESVATGALDVEGWLTSELSTNELKREMKRVKGVGDYAAENLLKLVGRYDVLALDSWVRATFKRTRNNNRVASDKKIACYYSRFHSWRGLALWCDITRDWLKEED